MLVLAINKQYSWCGRLEGEQYKPKNKFNSLNPSNFEINYSKWVFILNTMILIFFIY